MFCRSARAFRRERKRRILLAVPRHRSGNVVVRKDPRGGGAHRRVRCQRAVDRLSQARRVPGPSQEVEIEGGVKLVGPQVLGKALDVGKPDLPDQDPGVGIGIRHGPPAAVYLMQLVAIRVGMLAGPGCRRNLRQGRVLHQQHRRIDPDTGHATVEPEAEHGLVFGSNVRVAPVQVGLLGREQMEVPLAGCAVRVSRSRPGRAREVGHPAIGHLVAVFSPTRVEPEPGPFRRPGPRRESRLEPGVLVRNVVRDDVHDRPDAQIPGLRDQPFRLVERPERRVDRSVVGDVISAVGKRRCVPGSEPDGIDSQVHQVLAGASARRSGRRCRRHCRPRSSGRRSGR